MSEFNLQYVLDSMNEGVYVTDRDRKILYWSPSAARITGWSAQETVERHCSDNILVHVDKDGHPLCGREYCPLHRSMLTDCGTQSPVIIFAQAKGGRRIPMHVSVSPVHDEAGKVVGGVEVFRDLDGEFGDLRRARRIQTLAIQQKLPRDGRVRFAARYVPHDIVGGDYYAVARLDADRFGFMLGDVTGHGASAALYTVHLGSLWASNRHLIGSPGRFAQAMGNDLAELSGDEAFVTAICGVIDLSKGVVRIASAGGPCPVVLRQGACECLDVRGLPLGLAANVEYEEVEHPLRPGDCLLMFSDGAVEVNNAAGQPLDTAGLTRILREKGYPETAGLKDIEEALLLYSDRVRFDDDLTLLEARIGT